ncbi:AAA family ATPase [Tersicoccus sp. MR15.9]|uniref:AAA family ATPase n=1 Tax=Tersicoccus mangrovi TaxID=3121635 RepID=UPI002FE5CFA7
MTTIGIDLGSLGLDDLDDPDLLPPLAPDDAADAPDGRTLVPGSVLARALYEVWDGTPVVIVKSPPGAGKTTLIVQVITYLAERSDLSVVVATPTRRGAVDVARRCAAALGSTKEDPKIRLALRDAKPIEGVKSEPSAVDHFTSDRTPVVRTIASCKGQSRPKCDVMIIEEAYQSTYGDVVQATDDAEQVLMVGDPGQIGPVVSANVDIFRGRSEAPHMRAPEVYERRPYATVLSMDTTYRLGQETVDAIAPLYGFAFDSGRPDRWVADPTGNRIAEIVPVQVPAPTRVDDLDAMRTVADYAADMVGVEHVEVGPDGVRTTRRLGQQDVAVVVAHNAQVTAVAALLRQEGYPDIAVGTANSMQGGQWAGVVALDPLAGMDEAGEFQTFPGRLCVMASRHTACLVWVHDGQWEAKLSNPNLDKKEARLGKKVRRALTAE